MHILILEDNEADALAIRRELDDHYDVTVVASLRDGLIQLAGRRSRPDVIITDLSLPDSAGVDTVRNLREAADGIPIIISTGILTDQLKQQIQSLGPSQLHDKNDGFSLLKTFLEHERNVHDRLESTRVELISEIERSAQSAAKLAVDKAIGELEKRLDLKDEEALRMAIRWARAWETAKSRFIIAVANGLAAGLLIAIGAGVVALIKNTTPK